MTGAEMSFICLNIWYARLTMQPDYRFKWIPDCAFWVFAVAIVVCRIGGA